MNNIEKLVAQTKAIALNLWHREQEGSVNEYVMIECLLHQIGMTEM